MAIPEPSVTYLLDSYRFSWPTLGVDVVADRLHEDKSGLQCEATIMIERPPVSGLVRQGRFNMSATRTRTEWINVLSREYDQFPWHDIFEAICALSLKRWRNGAPTVDLMKVGPRIGVPYLLDPFVVESECSLLFADGGSGKSLLAIAMGATVATGEPILGLEPKYTGPVLYLDWEWDAETHAERLRAIARGAGIVIPEGVMHYRKEYASLSEGAATIRREIAANDIKFVIVDSLGFARGGEPESAELTLKVFTAARTFGVPCLFIDHIPKDAKDKKYSFGSVYTRNSVRASWRLDASKTEDGLVTSMGLTQAKENMGWEPPHGYKMRLERDGDKRLVTVTFTDTEYKSLPPAAKPKLIDQIISVLRDARGPMQAADTYRRLRELGVDCTEGSVKSTLSQNKEWFASGKQGYTLLAPRQEDQYVELFS